MDSARADILAAESHLQAHGWIGRHNESFRHLPPPDLPTWQGQPATDAACDAPPLAGTGWTLLPMGQTPAHGVDARWLDALDPAQRAELFAGLPPPGEGGDAAPFAWAHRALCRQGLRLRVQGTPGKAPGEQDTVWLQLRHQPRAQAEAPLLVLDVDEGVRCMLIESHEHDPAVCAHGLTQNLHVHIRLARGARLQHLRVAAPGPQDRRAHVVHATLAADAHYAQALVATGGSYHLQRCVVQLQGAGAEARHAGLLLAGAQAIDHHIFSRLDAPRTTSQVEALALASGSARAVANAYTRIAAGSDDASVRQRLSGIALDGQPRMVLRPHLEILHDQVQAVHGATWGALPADALFYARQRGLDETTARALIIDGMARAVLERCLIDADGTRLLTEWLDSGWLHQAIARHLTLKEPAHG
ncbi:SufD family Fe-S cluster assembly protein [Ottowia pentelensis]|uniref:SufD family Fe-S cluster assembly protein n=1 Tax=Ottowia pentelensis TaxID=511108 RepID=A0ABV6PVM0_9BURK